MRTRYFSRTGEQYDVGVIEKGNTAIVVDMIAQATGADLYEILPADDHYPMTYNALIDVAFNAVCRLQAVFIGWISKESQFSAEILCIFLKTTPKL